MHACITFLAVACDGGAPPFGDPSSTNLGITQFSYLLFSGVAGVVCLALSLGEARQVEPVVEELLQHDDHLYAD